MAVELIEVSKAIWNTSQQLDTDMKTLLDRAKDSAVKEKTYRIALAKKIITLRTEKVPATLIPDIARGSDGVSESKFQRDLSREMYKSTKELLKGREAQLSSLQTLIKFQKDIEGGE
mgnify:FL=1|jgi:hypothetical protein